MSRTRPTREELEAARDRLVPDVLDDGLQVLFSGINPGLYSAATGHHFARPGNRFWPALHRSGFTPHQLRPEEEDELVGMRLRKKVERHHPRWLAVLGVTAYRAAFGAPKAAVGPRPELLGGAGVWVLPNPSGLNAHWQPPELAAEFARLREASLADLSDR